MHVLRYIFTTLVATTLCACVVTETADTTEAAPPSVVRCSFLTADERAELVAAMNSAVTESTELQSYLAFWGLHSGKFDNEVPAAGTYAWNGSTWAYQGTSPTVVYIVGSVRVELSEFRELYRGRAGATRIEIAHDAQACLAYPECTAGDWTLYAEVSTGNARELRGLDSVSVRLVSGGETTWSFAFTTTSEWAYVRNVAPGGTQRIVTPLADPFGRDTDRQLQFSGTGDLFTQRTAKDGTQTFNYAGRTLTIEDGAGCGWPSPDDLFYEFPFVTDLLNVSGLERLGATKLRLLTLE